MATQPAREELRESGRVRPLRFPNRNGERLFGMVYEPVGAGARPRTGVLFCSDAIKYRAGTYRLHTLLGRWLAARGYYAMTFDPAGIGDSEGVFEEKFLREHYLDIQRGKYSHDLHDAEAVFRERCGLERVVLFGLCGGALSMVLAAADNPASDGLVLAALPVLVEAEDSLDRDDDEVAVITSGRHAWNVFEDFILKLRSPATWRRLLRLDIDWRTNARIAGKAASVIARKSASRVAALMRPKTVEVPVSTHPRFNHLFQRSFLAVAGRGRPMLFILADQDFITWQFRSEFADIVLRPGNPWEHLYEITELERSNHIFSSVDSRERLFDCIGDWLSRRFPVSIAD